MSKDLVIVESPAKARTINRFLGSKFETLASMGHVRDIPNKALGVNIADKTFEPTYRVMPDKKKVISEIAKASKTAEYVYLATDPDREGEAISWHLIKAAKIDENKVRRVVFHEITESAVNEAFDHPRELDQDLIDAQQARRVLDRIVGYELSPVLWKKVRSGLSAGRVQSVALRLMVDREREIEAFVPEEWWSIEADLLKRSENGKANDSFKTKYRGILGSKESKPSTEDEALQIKNDLDGAAYHVHEVTRKERKEKPRAPFTTSTLQQESYRKLRFTGRRTMVIAQQLYEGIELGTRGSVGLITYMRTDSTTVAKTAQDEARTYIKEKFGDTYAPKSPRMYTKKSRGAQEAHEAIRPTSAYVTPAMIEKDLSREQFKLYELIWQRMLASQMSDAVKDRTTVDIDAESSKSRTHYAFRATGTITKFDGYEKVYREGKDASSDTEDDEGKALPIVEKGDPLELVALTPEQHFTQPPRRFTDATIVKELEEQGIGRPSTYAATIATISEREYVGKEKGGFVPTKLGLAVTDFLVQHFANIMDIGFTAEMEERLDDISTGELNWVEFLLAFYYNEGRHELPTENVVPLEGKHTSEGFGSFIQEALENAERVPSSDIDEESDKACELCERPMVIKTGRFGRFLACSGFPDCRNSKPLTLGVECPEDGGEIVERRQRKKGGRKFYGCANYPNCNFVVNDKPLSQKCPECAGLLVESGRDRARCMECTYRGSIQQNEEVAVA